MHSISKSLRQNPRIFLEKWRYTEIGQISSIRTPHFRDCAQWTAFGGIRMTAEEELRVVGECIERLAENLPLAESLGADTTYLRVLLEQLRREAGAILRALSTNPIHTSGKSS